MLKSTAMSTTMPLSAHLNLLEQVDGSCSLKFADAQVITSVTGPIEVTRSKNEKPTRGALDINVRPSVGVGSTREALLASQFTAILEKGINLVQYPRKKIQIVVQMLNAGESQDYTVKELACMVNAVYLALLDAGIALQSSFLATCSAIDEAGSIIMRPSAAQLESSVSHHVVVYRIKDGRCVELIYSDSNGVFTEKQLLQVLDRSAEDIDELNKEARNVAQEAAKRDYVWQ